MFALITANSTASFRVNADLFACRVIVNAGRKEVCVCVGGGGGGAEWLRGLCGLVYDPFGGDN